MKKNNDLIKPDTGRISITKAFGKNLAILLSEKIMPVYKNFDSKSFIRSVEKKVVNKRYTERIDIIAEELKAHLPPEYTVALSILMQILGPENESETGMFTNFYWIMPIGKFVEKNGLNSFNESIKAIEEITKRNTGEYAIRPYARHYPKKTLRVCIKWAKSNNFHLRRLASEGLRPKLPWATKLETWNEDPKPIFEILNILKEDEVKFVKKSVANHLRDWIKINPRETNKLVKEWSKSDNENTKWILKHAQR